MISCIHVESEKKTDLIETTEDGAQELREEGRTAVDERGQSFIYIERKNFSNVLLVDHGWQYIQSPWY